MDQTPIGKTIYGIDRWGQGLIDVSDTGEIVLRDPAHPDSAPISLLAILRDLDERGIATPLVLRVRSFLQSEIRHINESFREAIARVN